MIFARFLDRTEIYARDIDRGLVSHQRHTDLRQAYRSAERDLLSSATSAACIDRPMITAARHGRLGAGLEEFIRSREEFTAIHKSFDVAAAAAPQQWATALSGSKCS